MAVLDTHAIACSLTDAGINADAIVDVVQPGGNAVGTISHQGDSRAMSPSPIWLGPGLFESRRSRATTAAVIGSRQDLSPRPSARPGPPKNREGASNPLFQ